MVSGEFSLGTMAFLKERFMEKINKILSAIDFISKLVAYIMGITLIALVTLVVFEVTLRYAFNSPTLWGTEFQLFLFDGIFLLVAAYTLQRNKHARVEVILNLLSSRRKIILETIYYIFIILPFTVVILIYGISFAAKSWAIREHSVWSGWQPALYPAKTIIPIAAFILFLQCLAELSRHIISLLRGK